jgi:hypothetical protein
MPRPGRGIFLLFTSGLIRNSDPSRDRGPGRASRAGSDYTDAGGYKGHCCYSGYSGDSYRKQLSVAEEQAKIGGLFYAGSYSRSWFLNGLRLFDHDALQLFNDDVLV